MKSMIKELWHGNIIPGEDSRTNSKEMKELLGYMAIHHEDLEKTFTDEQKEIFEKFHDCWDEYVSLAEAVIFEYAFCLGRGYLYTILMPHGIVLTPSLSHFGYNNNRKSIRRGV